ncbi:12824_t:CDS:2 [Entrophospora sp. SA101]|nr:6111_t:CDS:2 [Entrophospora sp. SA101]CAJ0756485.1 12824_t:CDS:2 [Entrophospora sp. SA101]CAJ0840334.1 5683_t:CDS:2 [Entrophospora sp. SA101]
MKLKMLKKIKKFYKKLKNRKPPISAPLPVNNHNQPPTVVATNNYNTLTTAITTNNYYTPATNYIPPALVAGENPTTLLKVLYSSDSQYQNIEKEFKAHLAILSTATTAPKIVSIIEIDMPVTIKKIHSDYKSKHPLLVPRRLYHGTKHCCDLRLIKDCKDLCTNLTCNACGIIKNGLRTIHSHSPVNGIKHLWFGPTPRVSHDYTGARVTTYNSFRAMFVVDVVSGIDYGGAVILKDEMGVIPRYLVLYSFC